MNNKQLRHVGRIVNTDQRCAVAFMQLPGREDHALVIPTDGLPPRVGQAVMEILESPEGQNDVCLANVLARRLLPDTGKNVLQALHDADMLKAVPVSNIVMLPLPNMPFPLPHVLAEMGMAVADNDMGMQKFDQFAATRAANSVEQNQSIARNLLIEADMLEAEVTRKRQQAYGYAPELEPLAISAPASSDGVRLVEASPSASNGASGTKAKPAKAKSAKPSRTASKTAKPVVKGHAA